MKINFLFITLVIIFFQSCQQINIGEENNIPIIKMLPVEDISPREIKLEVEVFHVGKEQIKKAGFVWTPLSIVQNNDYIENIALQDEDGIFIEVEITETGKYEAIIDKYIHSQGQFNASFFIELSDGTLVKSNVHEFKIPELDFHPWDDFQSLLNSYELNPAYYFYEPSTNNIHTHLAPSGRGFIYDLDQQTWLAGVEDPYDLPSNLPHHLFSINGINYFLESGNIFTFNIAEEKFDLLVEGDLSYEYLFFSFESNGIGYFAIDNQLHQFNPIGSNISFVAEIPFIAENSELNKFEVFNVNNKGYVLFKDNFSSGEPLQLWAYNSEMNIFESLNQMPFNNSGDQLAVLNIENRVFVLADGNRFWEYFHQEDRWVFRGWGNLRFFNDFIYFSTKTPRSPICIGQKCYFITDFKVFDLSQLPE